jgi:hypothetical protein
MGLLYGFCLWQGSGFAVGTGESILVMGAAADRRGGVLLFGCFGM